jgi:hypothetical protein
MSKTRDFYASLPTMSRAVLETLIELAEEQRELQYREQMAQLAPVCRVFRVLDVRTGDWTEI